MNKFPKFIAFKYKLSMLLFGIVLLVSSFLGICQYIIMRNSLVQSFELSKSLIRDRVLNILRDADYIILLNERSLEAEAREILEAVAKQYEAQGNINFDLEPFLTGKTDIHLYIIDENNTIIKSTDKKDIGLNFSPWPDFVEYLDEVRTNRVFSTARMSLSLNSADMMKYCYISPDGKYIFETGAKMDNHDNLSGIGFDNFEEKLVQDSDFIESIILFDYEGISYKKNEHGESMTVSQEHTECFNKTIETMETVEKVSEYNGAKAYYQYIPYAITGARGANERNVVEVIYNDTMLAANLRQNVRIIFVVVSAGALLAAAYGLLRARSMSKPLDKFTEGIKQVSNGNLDYSFTIESNDELSLLGQQFNRMIQDIRKLLDERERIQRALENKNREILTQRDEITALYEETAALNEELENLLRQNQESYFETVRALANAIEEKDPYTRGHCQRVMEYSLMIADALGLSKMEMEELKFSSILHDIGKIGVPEHILNKEGPLTNEEFTQVKLHPEMGHHILRDLKFLASCRRIVYEHHERIDGNGYPNGLKGSEIHLLARIICVTDAYDAMTSIRPYRKDAMPVEKAVQELLANRGKQFDEKIVDVFVECLKNNGVYGQTA